MRKGKKVQNVDTNKDHYEAIKWCFENDIKIYPKKSGSEYYLIIEKNGTCKSSGILHNENEYQQAIWDAYLYIYRQKK